MSFLMNAYRFVVAVVAGVTWDVLDRLGTVDLSNGNLTADTLASSMGAERGGVRATLGRSSGKHYFELTMDLPYSGAGYASPFLGLYRASLSLVPLIESYVATGAFGMVPLLNQWLSIQNDGANSNITDGRGQIKNGYGGITGNITIGFAVDLGTKRMWIRPNEIAFCGIGNPEFNQVPQVASLPSGTVLMEPTFTAPTSDMPMRVTANFGATPFKYPKPHGYLSWDASQPATVAPALPTRIGTIPSGISGCTAYIEAGNKTSVFSNFERTALCGDQQSPAVLRQTNSTANGFSAYGQLKPIHSIYQEDAFGTRGGVRVMSGRWNEVNNGYEARILSTGEARTLASYFGVSAGFIMLGMRFNHPVKKVFDPESPYAQWGYPLFNPGFQDLLYVRRPLGPNGDTHVQIGWQVYNQGMGTYDGGFYDVPVGDPVVVTAGLRSSRSILRINGVQRAFAPATTSWASRSYTPILFQNFPQATDEMSCDLSEVATWNSAVTDANLLLAEKYMASGMGLSI